MSEITSSCNVNTSSNVTGGVDYDSGTYTITFPAGLTCVPFDVVINDDNILEDNEGFTLSIIRSALPIGVTRSKPFVRVTIVDDECK